MKTLNLKKKGFTIVELVIVIAVIAILAAILIPTFVNITKKANLSADMVAVKEMNTILAAEEITDGKPATVVDAQEVLKSNGINDFTPMDANNAFYWVGSENRIILWTWNDAEKTTGSVVYPEEYEKKYDDVNTVSIDWKSLEENHGVELIEPEEGETVLEALISSISEQGINDYVTMKLPKDSTLELDAYAFRDLYVATRVAAGDGYIGKNVTIDLNGGKLSGDTSGYAAYAFYVYPQGSLTLCNGSLDVTARKASGYEVFSVSSGASLVLRNMDVKGIGYATFFPSSTASEVVFDNCNIDCGDSYYGLMTNGLTSDNVKVIIKDTVLKNNYSHGLILNVNSNTYIENSTITAPISAVSIRSGHLEIVNSTLITTDTAPGIYSYKNFAEKHNLNGYWSEGNAMAGGTLVLGDYSKGNGGVFSYLGDVSCTLTNVKLQSADSNEIPEILLASSNPDKEVTLDYDATSAVGSVKIYGEDWNPTGNNVNVIICNKGPIKVNGVEKGEEIYYSIPTSVGTFAAGSKQPISVLNETYKTIPEADYEASVKEQIEETCGITLSETEWASAKLTFSSTLGNNQFKSIKYTSDLDGEEKTANSTGNNGRITLSVGSLKINGTSYTDIPVSTIDFIEDAEVITYRDKFETNLKALGYTVTDSTILVIGDKDNCVVGIE